MLVQGVIRNATSGHGPGGTGRARVRRPQLSLALNHQHLFQWQIPRGVTAVGVSDPLWLSAVGTSLSEICEEDGVPCWVDVSHIEGDLLIDENAGSTPAPLLQPVQNRRVAMRAASDLAPTVNLDRRTASPMIIFTPAWCDFFGSSVGLLGNDGWLELIDRLRLEGFRVVILCHDAIAMARRLPDVIDDVISLHGMSEWVFRNLCERLCGPVVHPLPPNAERPLLGVSPEMLDRCWRPGMSPAMLRSRLEEHSRSSR